MRRSKRHNPKPRDPKKRARRRKKRERRQQPHAWEVRSASIVCTRCWLEYMTPTGTNPDEQITHHAAEICKAKTRHAAPFPKGRIPPSLPEGETIRAVIRKGSPDEAAITRAANKGDRITVKVRGETMTLGVGKFSRDEAGNLVFNGTAWTEKERMQIAEIESRGFTIDHMAKKVY